MILSKASPRRAAVRQEVSCLTARLRWNSLVDVVLNCCRCKVEDSSGSDSASLSYWKKLKPKIYRTTLSSKQAVKPASQCSWITAALQLTLAKLQENAFLVRLSISQGPFVPSCDRSRNAKRWPTLVTEEDASSKPGSKQIRLMEKGIFYRSPL